MDIRSLVATTKKEATDWPVDVTVSTSTSQTQFLICMKCVGSYLSDPGLVGRAALQVCQDAGEGVDLRVQAGASLLQGLLWSFPLWADMYVQNSEQPT